MLFNSYEFIFAFLPFTLIIYFFLISKRLIIASKSFLVLSSLIFYSWWNVVYLPIILFSMLFNYTIGNTLNSFNKLKVNISKKVILSFGIVFNLSLLGYFKYTDFLIENINNLTNSNFELLNLTLPLAISFFTFQQIAYLVDSYRDETNEYDFLNYALFVTFFPQLIAGPIVHHKEMMPQFNTIKNKVMNYKNIVTGLFIFSIGLFKKVAIADTFSVWATNGFDIAEKLNLFEAWATSLSYTFQLYFDFSGYTDMAIGIALMFNIRLPINFNSPYKSLTIQDFWRRWHITLSRFLRDYVYIPLGGNRVPHIQIYLNLILTFILGGLWHGAGWTFIFWGFLHGIALSVHRIWNKSRFKFSKIVAWFITFNFINISWIFFRAKNWDDAMKVFFSMFSLDNILLPNKLLKYTVFTDSDFIYGHVFASIKGSTTTTIMILCFILIIPFSSNTRFYKINVDNKILFSTIILMYLSILLLSGYSEFLYFRF